MINLSPSIQLDGGLLRAAVARAVMNHGVVASPSERYDSEGRVALVDTVDRFRADAAVDMFRAMEQRGDALPQGAGAMARQLEHIRSQVLEEERSPLSAFDAFEIDTSVPLGAKSYTSQMAIGQGEAKIHRGGNDFGNAKTTFADMTHQVQYVVCAVESNEFEMYSSNFANTRQYSRDLALAKRLVDEKLNDIAWNGAPSAGLYGIANYPELPTAHAQVVFSRATDGDAMVNELNRICDLAYVESGMVFRPNALRVSPAIHRILHTKRIGDSDLTAAEFFLKGQPSDGIQSIEMAAELKGFEGARHGIFAYNKKRSSIAHVMPQAPTILPVFKSSPLDSTTVVFAATGGIEMVHIGNQVLVLAEVA